MATRGLNRTTGRAAELGQISAVAQSPSACAVALGLRSRPQSSDLSRIRRNIVEDVRFV